LTGVLGQDKTNQLIAAIWDLESLKSVRFRFMGWVILALFRTSKPGIEQVAEGVPN